MPQTPYTMPSLTPMTQLWLAQWLEVGAPAARLQLQWLKTMDQMIESEAAFMLACLDANLRINECLLDPDRLAGKNPLNNCYQDIMSDVTEASMARLNKVSELSHEFRQQLWEEI